MRQKQAEGTLFPAGIMPPWVFGFQEGNSKSKKHLETNLTAAFAKKEAGSASSGGKK